MKYYQEITLIDAPEKPFFELWGSIYTQIHIALADIRNNHGIESIGVSFPSYKFEQKCEKTYATLGNKLRVFSPDKESLDKMNLNHWLERLSDYVHLTSPREVGDKTTSYLLVKRYQHINKEKQAREYAEFKGISYEMAFEHCIKYKRGNLPYPFINLKSEDTQQFYKLSIIQEAVENSVIGTFNTYGINTNGSQTTVPHW